MRRRTLLRSSTGLVALAAGCLGSDDEDEDAAVNLPDAGTIAIGDGTFDPRIVHVAAGGTVTWENAGEEQYTIDAYQFHADSKGWNFGESIGPGESATHVFEEEGRYDFIDPGHGQFDMCGRVRVGTVDEGGRLPCE